MTGSKNNEFNYVEIAGPETLCSAFKITYPRFIYSLFRFNGVLERDEVCLSSLLATYITFVDE